MKIEDLDNWYKDNDIHDYLHRHNLDTNKLIVDIGSYKGKWIHKMNELYGCKCVDVEPISEYFNEAEKLTFSNEIKLYNFGLTDGDQEEGFISVDEDASSVFYDNIEFADRKVKRKKIKLKNVKSFFNMIESDIDVLQINAEGLEYDIIPCIFKSDIVSRIKCVQVQFHDFYPNSSDLMSKCIDIIEQAGFKTKFNYPFVWYGAERLIK